MKTILLIINPKAGKSKAKTALFDIIDTLNEYDTRVITEITRYSGHAKHICKELTEDVDSVICAGGDGTLNEVVNGILQRKGYSELGVIPCGTGNDFAREFSEDKLDENGCIDLKPYLVNLPVVTVKEKKYLFLNGIGYGIDGYCARVGEDIRAVSTGDKPINYAAIAIKGIFFHFKPANATVTVDSQVHKFKKVWLAPTMNGNYYGGGMKITPNQDRLNKERTVTVAVWHTSGPIKTLMMFPKIFEGLLSQYPKHVSYFTGKQVKVEFDSPRDLQIDGETVRDVSEYSVNC